MDLTKNGFNAVILLPTTELYARCFVSRLAVSGKNCPLQVIVSIRYCVCELAMSSSI